ncbi:DeoR family transcriptional regulator [Meridianimarinicoccus roseus]|uniref:DeoR family transcriptional regulator n=1 Tax=Meridianimarinicoccus roseus TaxID=2072018 RepID=A0A2V2LJG6_9RHOB|nr:DeoR/GlpR family DNA-binding transcription regulator [Meridianimarinicoccus roseus]PWR02499.1 DeoR family transcriptional regulator [Meridianimarinicoccus roseus]
MKRDTRRQQIIDLLVDRGAVDVEDLARRFAVSKMTVHRDLDELEGMGLLRKVRGGASMEASAQFESDFRYRERQGLDTKQRLARAAMELVAPGMSVIVNDGSTAAVLGAMLAEIRPLTVITNNQAVIDALRNAPGITLVALGGVYSAKFNGYFGLMTEDSLARLRADIAFVSSPALDLAGVHHMDAQVIRSKRGMMAAATRRCLMVNHGRFGHGALYRLSGLDAFDTLITDAAPPPDLRAALDGAGVALTVAPPLAPSAPTEENTP